MKLSLFKALHLFSIPQVVRLVWVLLANRYNLFVSQEKKILFHEYIWFAKLIEKGFAFRKYSSQLIQVTTVINEKEYKVLLRKNTSDMKVFNSILVEEEYKLTKDILMKQGEDSPVIIDAGSNIGLTSIYFSAYFPDARILGLEPQESNFNLNGINIKKNQLESISIINKALWFNEDNLLLNNNFRDNEYWSFQVLPASTSHSAYAEITESITLRGLIDILSVNCIDLLKIDIEGAERFLFVNETFIDFLKSHVNIMVIEIHDEYEIRNHINSVMYSIGFVSQQDNDLTIYYRQKGDIEYNFI